MLEWWTVGLCGMGGLLLAAAGVWRLGAVTQRPRWVPNETKPDMPYKEVSFQSQGSTLHGWIAIPPGPRNTAFAAVVIVHGWGSNRSRVLRYAGPIYNCGYAVMLFDARSHGDSEVIKAPSALMFRDDVEAAVDYMKKVPGIDRERIAVLGHSLGGFGALLALGRKLRVKAVITDSTPVRFETMLHAELTRRKLPLFPLGILIPVIWLLRAGISRAEFSRADIPAILERNLQEAQVPVFMVHSLQDDLIPPDDLIQLAERMPVRHLLVNSAGHSASELDPAFWGRVLPFLQKHLA